MKFWSQINLMALIERMDRAHDCTIITLPHKPRNLRGKPHELCIWSTAHLDFLKVNRGIVKAEEKKNENELSNQAILLLQAHGTFKQLRNIVDRATLVQERDWQCDDSEGCCVWQSYAPRNIQHT